MTLNLSSMAPANSVAKLPVLLANVLARPLIRPAYRGAKSFGLLLSFYFFVNCLKTNLYTDSLTRQNCKLKSQYCNSDKNITTNILHSIKNNCYSTETDNTENTTRGQCRILFCEPIRGPAEQKYSQRMS